MALFNFGKKKEEEKKTPACACSCGCAASEAESITNDCCPDLKEGEICCIKVLGAGCKSCHEQFEYTKQAVKDTSPFLMTVQPFRICPSSPVISFLVRTRFPVSSKNTLREATFTSGSGSSFLSLKIRWI